MYNSSLKHHGERVQFRKHLEIPHKVFFNDLSKGFPLNEATKCDVIYSEIAWPYGYKGFNDTAENVPEGYTQYIDNVNSIISALSLPAFIVCGKNVKNHFPDARMYPITITTAGESIKGCTLFAWNCDYDIKCSNTVELVDWLSKRFKTCLDFSCGYGEHLLKFDDFVACDVNRDCLTYLSILAQEQERRNKSV